MSVNAADYNENGTLDANAARANSFKLIKLPNSANLPNSPNSAKWANSS